MSTESNSTTIYRLTELERKQTAEFSKLQDKLDNITTSIHGLNTKQAIHDGTSKGILDRLEQLEGKLDELQSKLQESVTSNSVELATIKTTMSTTEKYVPGGVAGGITGGLLLAGIELAKTFLES